MVSAPPPLHGRDPIVPPMMISAAHISQPEHSSPPAIPGKNKRLEWPRQASRASQMETEDINNPFYQPPMSRHISAPRTRKNKVSEYKGVSWNFLEKRWVAKVGASVLGLYDSEEAAAIKVREEIVTFRNFLSS